MDTTSDNQASWAHPFPSAPTSRSTGAVPHYDAVVVGARAAGAATAMLLARRGQRVLTLDRSAHGSHTLSTHALMRGGVESLHRWGLLDRVVETAPAIEYSVFEYAGDPLVVPVKPARGVEALYAPRRTSLDPILVDGAREAGATTLFDTRVTTLIPDSDGRVRGVEFDRGDGIRQRVSADIVIGADGLHSFTARQVGAPVIRRARNATANVVSYVADADLPTDRYIFSYNEGVAAGSIPTSDGLHCVFAAMRPEEFAATARTDVEGAYERTLGKASSWLAAGVASSRRIGRLRSFPGHPGQFRAAYGPGWALVGDAGYFKDPASAHGMTDAFRDAELLANAVHDGDIAQYQRIRDELSVELFETTDRLASFDWTIESLQPLHRAVSAAISDELRRFNAMSEVAVAMAS